MCCPCKTFSLSLILSQSEGTYTDAGKFSCYSASQACYCSFFFYRILSGTRRHKRYFSSVIRLLVHWSKLSRMSCLWDFSCREPWLLARLSLKTLSPWPMNSYHRYTNFSSTGKSYCAQKRITFMLQLCVINLKIRSIISYFSRMH